MLIHSPRYTVKLTHSLKQEKQDQSGGKALTWGVSKVKYWSLRIIKCHLVQYFQLQLTVPETLTWSRCARWTLSVYWNSLHKTQKLGTNNRHYYSSSRITCQASGYPARDQYSLGGWWDTCSAMKVTSSSEAHGSGPSTEHFYNSWKHGILFSYRLLQERRLSFDIYLGAFLDYYYYLSRKPILPREKQSSFTFFSFREHQSK